MEWKLLKDKKPKNREMVIVTDRYGEIYISTYYATRHAFSEYCMPKKENMRTNIIGWISLPKPLKDDEQ